MSSLYVRQKVREWAELPSVGIPYYDTINVEENPSDDVWFTAEFEPEYTEKQNFCGGLSEEGLINFVFETNAGIGDEALITAAESAVATILEQNDPSQDLVLEMAYAPDEYTGGTADTGYRVSISVEYYHRR